MKKHSTLIAVTLALSLLFVACDGGKDTNVSGNVSEVIPNGSEGNDVVLPDDLSSADLTDMDFGFTDRDKKDDYDTNDIAQGEDNGTTYDITKEGTYVFTGEITDKMITVSVGENDKVQIVLDEATIKNSKGPAIYIKSGDKVFITVKENTENTISDGTAVFTDDGSEIDGAIFSRADLTINGNGKLTVNGKSKHGIVSKDDIVIVNTELNVTSKNVGINGKDCVKISGGNITVNAGSDGIRSDNDEDTDRGFVYIESGNINIVASNDGIQAETAVKIDGGTFNIVSGGGSAQYASDSEESCKGIKAASDVVINGGDFVVDSLDDSLHSNNTICITGGTFKLSSSDDGIHADTDLAIAAGTVNVTKSYEGIEASRIFITGGDLDITASDDGINAAGGNDGSGVTAGPGMGGRPDKGGFSNGVGEIHISGGYTIIDASGDGIDSNGTFSISGGVVLVSGPTNNGNGSFDYDKSASVTGGILIALGSSGMAQGFSNAENQGAIFTTLTSQSANTSFALCGSDGKAIVSFSPKKAYQSVAVTAPEIQNGSSYSIYSGATVSGADKNGFARNAEVSGGTKLVDITMTSLLYSSGGGMGGPGGMQPPGGGGMQPPGGGGNRPPRP